MREICRIIGALVLILAVALFSIYKLNDIGLIKGSLGDWANNAIGHFVAIFDDTKEMLQKEGIVKETETDAGEMRAGFKENLDGCEMQIQAYLEFLETYDETNTASRERYLSLQSYYTAARKSCSRRARRK